MSSLVPVTAKEFDSKEIQLIRDTVAKLATPEEFNLFIHRCQSMGLDPLKPGEVFFIKYGSAPGVIVVGLEGFRKRAARTGMHSGTKRGAIVDENGKCTGAWCEVYRSDWTQPAREEVAIEEYMADKPTWKKMPKTMIKKVAECAALRMAFPDELAGLYGEEEMDQAAKDVTPPPNDETAIPPSLIGTPKPTLEDQVEAELKKIDQMSKVMDVISSAFEPKKPDVPWPNENARDPRSVPITVGFLKKYKTVGNALDKTDLIELQKSANWFIEQAGGNPDIPKTIEGALDKMGPSASMFVRAVLELAKRKIKDEEFIGNVGRDLTDEEEAYIEQQINEERMGRLAKFTPDDAMAAKGIRGAR